MRLIRPIVINSDNLLSTNVADTIPIYDAGTTYDLDDIVRAAAGDLRAWPALRMTGRGWQGPAALSARRLRGALLC